MSNKSSRFTIPITTVAPASQLNILGGMLDAPSVKTFDSAVKGAQCTITLQPSDNTFTGAHQSVWTNNWHQPKDVLSYVMVHDPITPYQDYEQVEVNGKLYPNARMNPLGQTDVFAVSKCSKAGFERTVDHFRADAFALESGNHAWLAFNRRATRPMTWISLHGILSPWLRLVDWEPER